ncbi:hypothetical protein RUM43_012809 [Polyplax serrata]|uniref:Uncharacterized protein n=1 Tax=Polyplax serrata TaxID=468196 RepID=A0AAN8NYJ3_POLSC
MDVAGSKKRTNKDGDNSTSSQNRKADRSNNFSFKQTKRNKLKEKRGTAVHHFFLFFGPFLFGLGEKTARNGLATNQPLIRASSLEMQCEMVGFSQECLLTGSSKRSPQDPSDPKRKKE